MTRQEAETKLAECEADLERIEILERIQAGNFEDVTPARVELVGIDGNAFSIMGVVARGLKRSGNPTYVIDAVRAQMMSGDYNHLLQVAMEVVEDPFGEDD